MGGRCSAWKPRFFAELQLEGPKPAKAPEVSSFSDCSATLPHVQENARLRAEVEELNDTMFSKTFKPPSAWAGWWGDEGRLGAVRAHSCELSALRARH